MSIEKMYAVIEAVLYHGRIGGDSEAGSRY